MSCKQIFKQPPSVVIPLVLTGPWMIPVWGSLCVLYSAVGIAVPAEFYRCPNWNLFFQGDTDWAGGKIYASAAFALLFFAIIGPIHAILRLKAGYTHSRYLRRLAKTMWIALPFFIVFLAVAWIMVGSVFDAWQRSPWEFCSPEWDIIPLFFSALVVNMASVAWVPALEGFRIPYRRKLFLAPMAAYIWFALASGGQTPRAGQMLEAGWEPLPAVRGARHQIMLTWHRHVLSLFGVHLPIPPTSSSLFFWTDGRLEFGRYPELSSSARALAKCESLPWLEGRTAYVVPIQVDDATPFVKLFPHHAYHRHHRGYFLNLPGNPIRIVEGYVEPDYSQFPPRDVFLEHGALYWSISWHSGEWLKKLRQLDLSVGRVQMDSGTERSSVASPTDGPLPPHGTIPVEISIPPETQYSQITNLLIQLNHDGYKHVFIRR